MTTKNIQIYLYIGVYQLYDNVLKIFSLPRHLSYIKKFEGLNNLNKFSFIFISLA